MQSSGALNSPVPQSTCAEQGRKAGGKNGKFGISHITGSLLNVPKAQTTGKQALL